MAVKKVARRDPDQDNAYSALAELERLDAESHSRTPQLLTTLRRQLDGLASELEETIRSKEDMETTLKGELVELRHSTDIEIAKLKAENVRVSEKLRKVQAELA